MEKKAQRARGLLWTSTAYFGEGLPWSFLHQLVMEYLTATGASAVQVGYTSWFHLPVTLKPLWSPLVDLTFTKRGWMLSTQLVMGIGMGAIAALVATGGGSSSAPLLWIVLAAIAVIHAMHDIACDGLYMIALDPREQALYSGTRLAAFRVAMYVGGSALVMLAAWASWPIALGAAGALMAVIGAVNAVLVPRPEQDGGAARAHGDGAARPQFWASYGTFLTQPHALVVLAFVITFGLSDALTFAMSSPLLDDLGVDLAHRGAIRGVSLTATIGGSILAGWIIARGGLERWLVPLTYLMATPFYFFIAALRPPFWGIAALVITEQFTGNLAATALTVFLMRRSRRDFSASHYAFFTALAAICRTAAGGFSGHLFEAVTHETYFAICFLAAAPAVMLVHFVPKTPIEPTVPPAPEPPNDEGRAASS